MFLPLSDKTGFKEQGLGTAHPKILLGSDFDPVRDLPSAAAWCTIRI